MNQVIFLLTFLKWTHETPLELRVGRELDLADQDHRWPSCGL